MAHIAFSLNNVDLKDLVKYGEGFIDFSFSDEKHCFICKEELTKKTETKEHVMPKWALRKYNAYNDEVTLLNESKINYRNIVVPCCRMCNEVLSEKLEKPIREYMILDKEVENENVWFYWANKIGYGLLYMEHRLCNDVANQNSDTIVSTYDLETLAMRRVFLEHIVFNEIPKEKLCSVFHYSITDVDENCFNFIDSNYSLLGIVMGNKGVMILYNDAGMYTDKFTEINKVNENCTLAKFFEIFSYIDSFLGELGYQNNYQIEFGKNYGKTHEMTVIPNGLN